MVIKLLNKEIEKSNEIDFSKHPAFGMWANNKSTMKEKEVESSSFLGNSWADDKRTVPEIMRELRGGRYKNI